MISFARRYPVDLTTSTGRTLPAFIELGLTGPVGVESGMVVNLVEIDQFARQLIVQFESQKFVSAEAALVWLRDMWILRAEKCDLRAGMIGVRGQFGRGRSRWQPGGVRRTEWKLRAYAVNPTTGSGGHLFAVAADRKQASVMLQTLRKQKSLTLESLARLEFPEGVFEIGYRERKSARRISVRA